MTEAETILYVLLVKLQKSFEDIKSLEKQIDGMIKRLEANEQETK